jgi:hypothetical protein
MCRWIGSALLLIVALPSSAGAATLRFAWDESADPVAGYRIHWGTRAGDYTNSLNVGQATSTVVSGLVAGRTYYFSVRSYDATGVYSPYSEPVMAVVPVYQPLADSGTAVLGLSSFPRDGGWYTRSQVNAEGVSPAWGRQSWQPYNLMGGETHPALGDFDGDGSAEIVFGLGAGSACWLVVVDPPSNGERWLQVPNTSYCAANGETFPATGDVDGDGRDEIVVGLGKGSNGRVYVFDDAAASYTLQRQLILDWPAYNSANGTVHPAVGDVDGDGLSELVLGLGKGSAGWVRIVDDHATLAWSQVSWAAYNSANGTTWPAVGDVDGDKRGEIVLGLGTGGGGWLEVLDDQTVGLVSMNWLQVDWGGYNASVGETRPALGNLDSDEPAEILIGLGNFANNGGWFVVHDDAAAGGAELYWDKVQWAVFEAAGGGLFPAVSTRPF